MEVTTEMLGKALDRHPDRVDWTRVNIRVWKEFGKCKDKDPSIFLPEDTKGVKRAQDICSGCRVKAPCLEYALSNRLDTGVWGGTSEKERARMLRQRDLQPQLEEIGWEQPEWPNKADYASKAELQEARRHSFALAAVAALAIRETPDEKISMNTLVALADTTVQQVKPLYPGLKSDAIVEQASAEASAMVAEAVAQSLAFA